MSLSDQLDLQTAWKKAKTNLQDNEKSFVNSPYLITILNHHEEEWLESIRTDLEEEFTPRPCRVVDVPKPAWHLRPAGVLDIRDVVVYSAAILDVYEDIYSEIQWSEMSRRFSHILLEDKSEENWTSAEDDPWESWNSKSFELTENHDYVLRADISGFYENINIENLIFDLQRTCKGNSKTIELLELCLNYWAGDRGRGIPQGYYASDILAELYLDEIDRLFDRLGIPNLRFNDDMRIFCDGKETAIDSLRQLTLLCRRKGLNLQSAKTSIMDSEAARSFFETRQTDVRTGDSHSGSFKTSSGLAKSSSVGSGRVGSSGGSGKVSDDLPTPEDIEIEEDELVDLFESQFLDNGGKGFNRYNFRWMIERLGIYENDCALDYCLERMLEGREDVRRILDRYFYLLDDREEIAVDLAEYVESGRLQYDYHEFLIMRWFWDTDFQDMQSEVLRTARNIVEAGHAIPETVQYSIAILTEYGGYADRRNLKYQYESIDNSISRSILIYCLKELNAHERGPFLDGLELKSIYDQLAVKGLEEVTSD